MSQFPDMLLIMPEIILVCAGMLMLLLELVVRRKETLGFLTIIAASATLYSMQYLGSAFDGMYLVDGYSIFFKIIVLINLVFCVLLSLKYLRIEKELKGEYFALLMFATTGMMLMASAGDLIVFYLGLELMALSTYILAGFIRQSPRSNEAAMKYFLLGAFSSALLLYGIALIYGMTGTTDLSKLGVLLMQTDIKASPALLVALVLFVAAFGFKVAAAPFHMWAPDVYEGAPTAITAFMSVGPKAAAFAAMGRVFLVGLSGLTPHWGQILIGIAILTMAVGNIIALSQTNIKRMLAYSSIAHAGYAMLGLVPGNAEGVTAMMNYLFIYAFMNIGAFAVVVMLRSETFKGEALSDYEGLAKTHPLAAALMLIFMFALTGIPTTGGFIGKFYLFIALINSGYAWLAVVAAVFSVISAYFYLRVVMLMYMREPSAAPELSLTPALGLGLLVAAVMVIAIGILPDKFIALAKAATLL